MIVENCAKYGDLRSFYRSETFRQTCMKKRFEMVLDFNLLVIYLIEIHIKDQIKIIIPIYLFIRIEFNLMQVFIFTFSIFVIVIKSTIFTFQLLNIAWLNCPSFSFIIMKLFIQCQLNILFLSKKVKQEYISLTTFLIVINYISNTYCYHFLLNLNLRHWVSF